MINGVSISQPFPQRFRVHERCGKISVRSQAGLEQNSASRKQQDCCSPEHTRPAQNQARSYFITEGEKRNESLLIARELLTIDGC